jgi:hypothetical protein
MLAPTHVIMVHQHEKADKKVTYGNFRVRDYRLQTEMHVRTSLSVATSFRYDEMMLDLLRRLLESKLIINSTISGCRQRRCFMTADSKIILLLP